MLRPQLTVELRQGFVLVPPGVNLFLQLFDQLVFGIQLGPNIDSRSIELLLESFNPLRADHREPNDSQGENKNNTRSYCSNMS